MRNDLWTPDIVRAPYPVIEGALRDFHRHERVRPLNRRRDRRVPVLPYGYQLAIATSDTPATGIQDEDNVAVTPSYTNTGDCIVVKIMGNNNNSSLAVIVTVTYNGVSVPQRAFFDGASGVGSFAWIGVLASPATGANTLSMTVNTQGGGWNGGWGYSVSSYTGCDTASPTEAPNTAFGLSTTASVVVTTVTANAWVLDSMCVRVAGTITKGASQTLIHDISLPTWNFKGGTSSQGPVVTPGATTMTWTVPSENWAIAAVALKPASGGGGGGPALDESAYSVLEPQTNPLTISQW